MKKLLSLALLVLLLAFCVSCKNDSADTNNGSPADKSSVDDATEHPTDKGNTTDNTNQTDEQLPDGDAENTGDASADIDGKLLLSGENRYRVIYASGSKKMALKIQDKLISLDPLSFTEIGYYKLSSDESTTDDGTPEILVGITNREESLEAAKLLKTYLDYSISTIGNKIVIVANTPERLESAVEEFLSLIEAVESGDNTLLLYRGDEQINNEYSDYPYDKITFGDISVEEFEIVIPDNAKDEEKEIANRIRDWLRTAVGVTLEIKTDASPESDYELLIGATNRAASASVVTPDTPLENGHYCLKLQNGKLVIAAGNKKGYVLAFSNLKGEINQNQNNLMNGTDIMNTQTIRSLDGKNILFAGNSFVYYGYCVIEGNQKSTDYGYLYEICKANGDNVNVYDYVWGGKDLKWIYDNHLSVADPEFLKTIDIVFLSEAGNNNAELVEDIEEIMALFPENTECYYMSHAYAHQANSANILASLPRLVEKGIPVGDWGAIAFDLWTGKVKFPESKLTYNKETFIKNNGDYHHQNMLSGYLTAQMAYCLATGVSAVGQDYSFCCDTNVNPAFDVNAYIEKHYTPGSTNMDKVFESPYDMLEIQKLIDKYIDDYNFS